MIWPIAALVLGSTPSTPQLVLYRDKLPNTIALGKYRFKLTYRTVKDTAPSESDANWGQDPAGAPKKVIWAIRATYNGNEEVILPMSAYRDLYDVNFLMAKLSKTGCTLTIAGSDTGEEYSAVLKFHRAEIRERDVNNSEMGEMSGEKTYYSWADNAT